MIEQSFSIMEHLPGIFFIGLGSIIILAGVFLWHYGRGGYEAGMMIPGCILVILGIALDAKGALSTAAAILWYPGFAAAWTIESFLKMAPAYSPLVSWFFFGLITGSAAGLWVSGKKYNVPRLKQCAVFFISILFFATLLMPRLATESAMSNPQVIKTLKTISGVKWVGAGSGGETATIKIFYKENQATAWLTTSQGAQETFNVKLFPDGTLLMKNGNMTFSGRLLNDILTLHGSSISSILKKGNMTFVPEHPLAEH